MAAWARSRTGAGVAAGLLAAGAAVAWWLAAWPPAPAPGPAGAAHATPAAGSTAADRAFAAALRAADAAQGADPLLVDGLRDTLEAMLLEAGDAADPATLKQRLQALAARHFPPALAPRALALAGRYVDYRVALGRLRSPTDPTDPGALREALLAREGVRRQFFDDAEYAALFTREAELDRYTLARLEILRNGQLTPAQRDQALQAADQELPAERRAQRQASVQHLEAAAQTAAFDAQGVDEHTRHTARRAAYGDSAAHALAQLDREERQWQARLDEYAQARAAQPAEAALQSLRQRLFTPEEQLRIDAALALRSTP